MALKRVHWTLIVVAGLVVVAALGPQGSNQPAKTEAQAEQEKADRRAASQKEKFLERMERQMKAADKETGLDASCTAAQLHREFAANEVRADAKYKGKWVEVRGRLASVAKGVTGTPYLNIAADEYGVAHVQAHLFEVQARSIKKETFSTCSASELAAELAPGQQVSVECLGKGMVLTIPQLDQCVVIPTEK